MRPLPPLLLALALIGPYARTFETLRKLPCDLFLAPHGSFFDLAGKAAKLRQGARPNPFLDAAGWRRFLDRTEERFRKQLAEEKAARTEVRGSFQPRRGGHDVAWCASAR